MPALTIFLVNNDRRRYMKTKTAGVLKEALGLPSNERAELANRLLSSLDNPDKSIDALWRREIDDRIAAYKTGKAKTVSVEEVLAKYKTK